MLEHRAEKAKRPRFRRIKVLHQDYSSWKINHNKLAAAEDFSLILTTIASISTSKRHKGFLQLSLDASRRLSAFLSITLKVAVEGAKEGEFVGESAERCSQMFPVESVEVSITFITGIIIKMSRVAHSKYQDRQIEKWQRLARSWQNKLVQR